jgi:hypothetical protein
MFTAAADMNGGVDVVFSEELRTNIKTAIDSNCKDINAQCVDSVNSYRSCWCWDVCFHCYGNTDAEQGPKRGSTSRVAHAIWATGPSSIRSKSFYYCFHYELCCSGCYNYAET